MKKILISATCLIAFLHSGSQDIHFSQINETPLVLNPASAGTGSAFRGIINYRDQWRSVTAQSYKTFDVSADFELRKKEWKSGYLGGGLVVFHDKAGTSQFSTLNASLSLSGIVMVNKQNRFSVGLSGGFGQRSFVTDGLKWDSQYNGQSYDPNLPSNEMFTGSKFSYGDYAAGVQWLFGEGERYITAGDEFKANFGVSVFHLNQPKQAYTSIVEKMEMKLLFSGGFAKGLGNSPIAVAPSFMYAMQGPTAELYIGSMVKYKFREDSKYTGFKKGASFSVGGFYRSADAMVGVLQLEIAQYSIGFSYDFNTSDLRTASDGKGGFEISLRFNSSNPYIYKSSSSF
ncbi:MAG: PorP/SprF family type IX secretion system membrane protein [Bacteroidia bacterium]|nr:PorP/SprF family type IX secretion system membrane protein [Bacteroidia bacterium]